jgi:arylsulfatase A-like enzyme
MLHTPLEGSTRRLPSLGALRPVGTRPSTLLGLALGLALAGAPSAQTAQGNVLVILADDLGAEQLASYGLATDLPSTPNLDQLALGGLQFENCWSNPVCSPTRATIQTGRYSFRTGVGQIAVAPEQGLPLAEIALPELLDIGTSGTYAHAAFGKWHLGDSVNGLIASPNLAGYSHFAGTYIGLDPFHTYEDWDKIVNGSVQPSVVYNTSEIVNDVLAWTSVQQEPWFAYVAFNAAHSPYHAPPPALHSVDLSTAQPPTVEPRPYYKAMVEAMDTELGRLLAGLGPALNDTTVIFLGDNGTPGEVAVAPVQPWKAKKTLYQGGVLVPLIVSGPGVSAVGGTCDALVNTTDVYATVAQLCGFQAAQALPLGYQSDSVSFAPYLTDPGLPSQRRFAYAEFFTPNGPGPYIVEARAIRDRRYKLVRTSLSLPPYDELFFDLKFDPWENRNLLLKANPGPDMVRAYRRLNRELNNLLEGLVSPGLTQY